MKYLIIKNQYKVFYIFLAISVLVSFCSLPTESKYDPPSDHTISKDGAKHKSGIKSTLENCISCHGSDLKGGTSGVSCYESHRKKW